MARTETLPYNVAISSPLNRSHRARSTSSPATLERSICPRTSIPNTSEDETTMTSSPIVRSEVPSINWPGNCDDRTRLDHGRIRHGGIAPAAQLDKIAPAKDLDGSDSSLRDDQFDGYRDRPQGRGTDFDALIISDGQSVDRGNKRNFCTRLDIDKERCKDAIL